MKNSEQFELIGILLLFGAESCVFQLADKNLQKLKYTELWFCLFINHTNKCTTFIWI